MSDLIPSTSEIHRREDSKTEYDDHQQSDFKVKSKKRLQSSITKKKRHKKSNDSNKESVPSEVDYKSDYTRQFNTANDALEFKTKQMSHTPFYGDFEKDLYFERTHNVAATFSHEKSHSTVRGTKRKHESLPDDNDYEEEKEERNKELCSKQTKDERSSTEGSSNTHPRQNKVEMMMQKMGYQKGKGLGKCLQGRTNPIEASKQCGRSGLGHTSPEFKVADLTVNWKEEVVKVEEDMIWLENVHTHAPTADEMEDWQRMGKKKLTIDDETLFCDPNMLTHIIQSKTMFNNVDKNEMRKARTCSNPFETIRGAFFLNRAAVKMANIDKACDFMFTEPRNMKPNELLYFADVCAGPGGFSEYVLWRKKWHAKGFGFTLRNENDFKLDDFHAGPCETFHPFYGPKENGDVYDTDNQKAFKDTIMRHTNNKGLHFMMSDGGFSVEGQENVQEILSKQLYLCQCLVALMTVKVGGHFVTKLFDLFTPYSAGLIYLMYRCFDAITIFKPNTSRPANSERYLICKRKRPDTYSIMNYLYEVNRILLKNNPNEDVIQLVPLEELEMESRFVQYLRNSNNSLGKKQIIGLHKIAAFCKDNTLTEPRQPLMRTKCLEYWSLPDENRTIKYPLKPHETVKALVTDPHKFLTSEPGKLTVENIKHTVLSQPFDWVCIPCNSGQYTDNKVATFYLGMGRKNVYRYVNDNWIPVVSDFKIELPRNTLVYAEIVQEASKESKYQLNVPALHILDAYVLGSENVSQKFLPDRFELIRTFCEALWKPYPENSVRVRAKEFYPLNPCIDSKLQIIQRDMKNKRQALTCEVPKTRLEDQTKSCFILNSIIFLRSTARPWFRHYSKKTQETYVFNSDTKESHFDIRRPSSAEAKFDETFMNRIVWYWPSDQSLNMDTLMHHIREYFQSMNSKR